MIAFLWLGLENLLYDLYPYPKKHSWMILVFYCNKHTVVNRITGRPDIFVKYQSTGTQLRSWSYTITATEILNTTLYLTVMRIVKQQCRYSISQLTGDKYNPRTTKATRYNHSAYGNMLTYKTLITNSWCLNWGKVYLVNSNSNPSSLI